MTFAVVILSLVLLIVLISKFKVDAFLAFLLVSILTGIALGIPVGQITGVVEKGIGSIMGGLTLIIVLGAMLGKLVADSGAAQKIAGSMMRLCGEQNIQWGLMVTGFVIGIPLFYGVGFVLLVPLIFSISYRFKLPLVYTGLPMLAALSVTHGFTPPHPSPVALAAMFGADLGMTLIYGLIAAIPAIVIGGPLFSKTLRHIESTEKSLFRPGDAAATPEQYGEPSTVLSFFTALLPVALLILASALPYMIDPTSQQSRQMVQFAGSASIVMLVSLVFATWSLGLRQGRSMKDVMGIYAEAVKDIAGILLIIAGSGIFKEVMEQSGVSQQLAESLKNLPIHPIFLAWLITAIIRGCVGSATVAALTSAGVLLPLILASGVRPELMVLTLGAGSLMFSHVNDSGFWMFKEYFGLSLKDTFKSWSVMEAIVSIVGLLTIFATHLLIGGVAA